MPDIFFGHPSAPVTPDIRYRESILVLFRIDPGYKLERMTEPQGGFRPYPSLTT